MVSSLKAQVQTKVEFDFTGEKKRIGILGGTFNPPHLGHLLIAEQVANVLDLDMVMFMPNAMPPHIDPKVALDPRHRASMVQAAIAGNSRFALELLEVQRGGKSYTFNTMLQLKLEHPNYEYYFIIGADEVNYLTKWYRIDDLLKLVHFVGVNRPGQVVRTNYPVNFVTVTDIGISSTDIRQRLQRGQSIRYLVPDMVAAYIFENGLYLK
ncbi:nicotinate mononucleotide adenylyltransferase [Weissella oryzae SG25]|uniref:Probable nicotinate-nucleotide adenylyltransferase n=1 Tax=Weissella oryzae (strain DSM 25784 / JCM 18191 / LMG 30913 / SG25) TaxID=1329250 RepID=A0A069CZR1_WEIOS|nr:nicotinate-nucleotide adenylyltransferase [Weissella oryzae]GAK30591.1 nicotinate mononucleotide adenylyltransferase [Weissella oryzae SG25]